MLKANLQLRIGQNLTLTPQLQQTIRLLQYSTLELQQQIQEMIEQNPLLDLEEPEQTSNEPAIEQENPYASASSETELPGPDATQQIPAELAVDSSWDSIYDSPPPPPRNSDAVSASDLLENQPGAAEELTDHLLEQLALMPLGERDRLIGQHLILNINDDGYLAEPIEEIRQEVNDTLDLEDDDAIDIESVRVVQHLIMQFDPPGCCAENLQQSLISQIRQSEADGTTKEHALLILERCFPELEKQNLKKLTARSGLTTGEVEAAIELIRRQNPRPGAEYSQNTADYVTPDVYVTQHEGEWLVSLNPEISPRLRVHPYYSTLVKRGDKSADNQYIREQLQEARWFIKSIQSRNSTILRVAEAIVEKQRAFFEQGEEAMKPMVLRDIAEELEMHESTISRVTTNKYMLTPRGMFEFKYFFSSQLGTSDGGNASATAIKAMIRTLISEEDPQKPLSDSKITSILLNEKGVKVARRTVAKYREAMHIPPSNERKRIA